MIEPRYLEALRDAVPVSAVVGRHVKLLKAGREFKACCPFHHEKTPSFTINDDKGFAHCFGCGAHGDVVEMMMRLEKLSFPEAVERLAALANMPPPTPPTPEEKQAATRRVALLDLLDEAAKWMESQLWESEAGGPALAYLRGRGLTDETIRAFRLGWAPVGGALAVWLKRRKIDPAAALAAGLLADGERGPYPFLRGRIAFPIGDRRGRIVAFGGRILPQEADNDGSGGAAAGPKYLNFADSELFAKGRQFYGGARAANAARDGAPLVVVEGYLDVIQAVQAGFTGAVAPLGTAVTETQIKLALRWSDAPIFCLDGDAAGERAAARTIERLAPALTPGKTARFAALPPGDDPDSLLRREGVDAFAAALDAAKALAEVWWGVLAARGDAASPEGRAALEVAFRAALGSIADADVRRAYRADWAARARKLLGYPPKLDVGDGSDGGANGGPNGGRAAALRDAAADDAPCPVTPLGSVGAIYHYLTARGEYLSLKAALHTDAGLSMLACGELDWFKERFPDFSKKGDVGVLVAEARDHLFRLARKMPVFNPRRIRGPGLWPDGDGGAAVHIGVAVSIGDGWRPAGVVDDRGWIYPLDEPLEKPAATPGSAADWRLLFGALGRWRWTEPDKAILSLVGWVACAMLCGLIWWNPGLWLNGDTSTGKSTLLKLLRAVLGGGWSVAVSDPSEPSVRGRLGARASPILIDEIEGDKVDGRAGQVAKLLRLATDPDQAPTTRVGEGGQVIEQPVRAALAFSSVRIPYLEAPDRNRLAILDLEPLDDASAADRAAAIDAIAEFAKRSPHMRARMLSRWKDAAATRRAFEGALLAAGHRGRALDQVGALLTAAWLALQDGPPTAAGMADWVGLFAVAAKDDLTASEGAECLQFLLTSSVEQVWDGNIRRRLTVAQSVNNRRQHGAVTSDLRGYGLSIETHPETGERCLVVANVHQGLAEVFAGSKWAAGAWADVLGKRLKGALKSAKLLSLGGSKTRATWIPLSMIPDGRDFAEDDDARALADG